MLTWNDIIYLAASLMGCYMSLVWGFYTAMARVKKPKTGVQHDFWSDITFASIVFGASSAAFVLWIWRYSSCK
jgi:hypothetical protein